MPRGHSLYILKSANLAVHKSMYNILFFFFNAQRRHWMHSFLKHDFIIESATWKLNNINITTISDQSKHFHGDWKYLCPKGLNKDLQIHIHLLDEILSFLVDISTSLLMYLEVRLKGFMLLQETLSNRVRVNSHEREQSRPKWKISLYMINFLEIIRSRSLLKYHGEHQYL